MPGRRLLPWAVLLLAGCGGGTKPAALDKPTPAAAPDKQIAVDFLNLVRVNKVDEAWAGTSAEFKNFMGKEEFRGFVRKHAVLKQPAEPGELTVLPDKGYPAAECLFRTTGAKAATVRVQLGSDNGTWKVERVAVE
jgi:hypothetical protein